MQNEKDFLTWVADTLVELNLKNYNDDSVAEANGATVEVLQAIQARLTDLETNATKSAVLDLVRPISDAPLNGEIVFFPSAMRYLPYKPGSEQFRKGLKGRWQEDNGYGWENIRGGQPKHFLALPQDFWKTVEEAQK